MRQKLLSVFAGMIVFMNTIAAQFATGHLQLDPSNAESYSNSYIPLFSFKSRHSLNNIHLHAVRDFLRRYSEEEAKEATWQISEKGDFVARFSVDSVDIIAAYGKNGNWLYSVRRYSESKLPQEIKSFVKDQYDTYSIVHGDEISLPFEKNTVYIISIQNDAEIKILRISNGQVEVTNTYKR